MICLLNVASRSERTLLARRLNSACLLLETATLLFDLQFRASLNTLGVRPLIAALRDAARRCKLDVTTRSRGDRCGSCLCSVLRVLPGVGNWTCRRSSVGCGCGCGCSPRSCLLFLLSSLRPFCPACRRRISASSAAVNLLATVPAR